MQEGCEDNRARITQGLIDVEPEHDLAAEWDVIADRAGVCVTATITFFEVVPAEGHQYFLFDDNAEVRNVVFDGSPKLDGWSSPAVFSYQPRLREGSFWSFDPAPWRGLRGPVGGAGGGRVPPLACEEAAAAALRRTRARGRQHTACVDTIDREATSWHRTGQAVRRRAPGFRLDRLRWNLFKVPGGRDLPHRLLAGRSGGGQAVRELRRARGS